MDDTRRIFGYKFLFYKLNSNYYCNFLTNDAYI